MEYVRVLLLVFLTLGSSITDCASSVTTSPSELKNIFVAVERRVLLECNIGQHTELYWERGQEVFFINTIRMNDKFENSLSLLSNYSLLIIEASPLHDGIYKCGSGSKVLNAYRVTLEGMLQLLLFFLLLFRMGAICQLIHLF